MTTTSVEHLLAPKRDNPAIDLVARTTTAPRTDSRLAEERSDVFAGGFLDDEAASASGG
ncbi:MAG TPA: hypothetical protein VE309_07645 [Caulobacteraceae bacterium]|jgi:hypothetical protein|nr:hypothetical protein [Caulobacteraceae bacterium]